MKTKFKSLTSATVILAVFVLFQFAGTLQAQPRGGQQGPPKMPNDEQIKEMVQDLSETLSLTEEQEQQVSDKYTEHFAEMKAKMDGNQRPDRDEMESMKSDFEADIKSLLTKDQQKLYKSYLKENQPKPRR